MLALRRLRYPVHRIATALKLSPSTASRALRRHGLNCLRSLDPPFPAVRYELRRKGDTIHLHLDTERLARIVRPGHRVHGDRTREKRGAGWEYLHIAIDDHSRVAYAAILPDQTHHFAMLLLYMARARFSRFASPAAAYSQTTALLARPPLPKAPAQNCISVKRFPRAYRPQINGKAERFIQTVPRARTGLMPHLLELSPTC